VHSATSAAVWAEAAWQNSGDEAHLELMGMYALSGSICSSGGFKCHKQLVPDVSHDATQMDLKLKAYLLSFNVRNR